MKDDYISRKAAIDAVAEWFFDTNDLRQPKEVLCCVPSAQPEIIRCNSCKYWTQTTGEMKGYGLGWCDFHEAHMVPCNGFCYWAEREKDER